MGEEFESRLKSLACLPVNLFYELIDKIPFSVIVTNNKVEIEYVNHKFEELTGYQLDEVKGQNPSLLQSGCTEVEIYQEMWETITAGEEWEGELCNQKKDGENYWQRVRVFPLQDESNKIKKFVAIEDEVVKERRLRKKLKKEREFLRKIIDTTPNIVFVKDWNGVYELANQSLAEIYGTTIEELEGSKDINFNTELEEVNHFLEDDRQVMESGETKIIKEEELTDYQGEELWFQTIKIPLNIESPKEERSVLGVASDITHRKKLEQLKEQLISNVSHEIRTPLGSVLGFVELLLEREFSKEKEEKYLELIHREASRLKNLINDFLDIQRLERKRDDLDKENFKLKQVINEVLEVYKVHDNHNFRLNFRKDIKVNADFNKLKQVVSNLISNAIKYSPNKSEIIISCEEKDNQVMVKIKDKGLGISDADQEELFSEFYRASNSNDYQGTGLGLAISKKIIEQHNGEIGVNSTLGEGSCFYFSLPKMKERREEE